MPKTEETQYPSQFLLGFVLSGAWMLFSCSVSTAQPDGLNDAVEKSRTAVAAMLENLNGRCFAFTREQIRSSKGIQRREYSLGIVDYRVGETYACYRLVRQKDEGKKVTTEVEILETAELRICSLVRDGAGHEISCTTSNRMGRRQENAPSREFDVSVIFTSAFAGYLHNEFAVPAIDEDGRFYVSFSRSMTRRFASESSFDQTYQLFFEPDNDLPSTANVLQTSPNVDPILIADRRVSYTDNPAVLPRSLISITFDESGNVPVNCLEFRLLAIEPPPWSATPVRFAVTKDSRIALDGESIPNSVDELPETMRPYLVSTDQMQFEARQKNRTASFRKVELNPPAKVELPSRVTVAQREQRSPSPSVFSSLAAIATGICILLAMIWLATWVRFQSKD